MAEAGTSNVAEFSVSEISGALKRLVEDSFSRVRVRGEISGYRGPHSSGHAYFRLKDDKAALEAVIWKGVMGSLRFRPEEGMEVIATGKLTTFPGSSKYQIVIDTLEPAGAGALMALLEERKRKLAAEGLFDAARKQLLPFMPRHIGVVTSPTGAVIRDILHRVMDRFPCRVTVWPVRVQGETTGIEVAVAVNGFNAFEGGMRPDVLIVARGGGSLEDLWGFNDELIVRAVAASGIPVISAVGHETDWTLIDLAADVRAPTPTAAAEMAVPVKAELEATLASLGARLSAAVTRGIDRRRQAAAALARGLPASDAVLAIPRRRFDEAGENLRRALELNVERKGRKLAALRISERPVMSRIEARLSALASLDGRLARALPRTVGAERNRLATLSARLDVRLLERPASRGGDALAKAWARALTAYGRSLERRRARLEQAGRLAETLSHKAVLKRGYAYAVDEAGRLVASASALRAAGTAMLHFGDDSTITVEPAGKGEVAGKGEPASRPSAARAASRPPGGQPTLFED